MIVTQPECVSVALFIQHTKGMRRIIWSSVARLTVPYFYTLSHKRHDFRKKVFEHTVCVLIVSTTFASKVFLATVLLNYHTGRFVLGSLCVGNLVRLGLSSVRVACFTDVVIQQHSRKLLMMDILMSETCWVHKKWNKIASDIKLVIHSWTITMT